MDESWAFGWGLALTKLRFSNLLIPEAKMTSTFQSNTSLKLGPCGLVPQSRDPCQPINYACQFVCLYVTLWGQEPRTHISGPESIKRLVGFNSRLIDRFGWTDERKCSEDHWVGLSVVFDSLFDGLFSLTVL